MNNDEFCNGYVTGETDAKNGAEPMVYDCQTGDFMAGYEMAYYNNKKRRRKTMSFDAEKEWKTLQIAAYSKNLFLEMAKDRNPCECLAIIHDLIDILFISIGCEKKAISDFGNKFHELIDEVFIKSGVKK